MTSEERELIKDAAEELECMIDVANREQDSENCYNYDTCYKLLKLAVEN